MKKDFIIKTLNRLKENDTTYNKIKELGIDPIEMLDKMGVLSIPEEAIAIIISDGNERVFEKVLEDVQWWLYEDVEKKITVHDVPCIVETAEQFTEWLFNHYEAE